MLCCQFHFSTIKMFLPSCVFAVVATETPWHGKHSEHAIFKLTTSGSASRLPLTASACTLLVALLSRLPKRQHAYVAVKRHIGEADAFVCDSFISWLDRSGAPPAVDKSTLAALSHGISGAAYCSRRGQITKGKASAFVRICATLC